MDLTKLRWTEIQFYYICSDTLKIRNNIMDVMEMIDHLAIIGNYSPEQIKPLAQEVIASHRYRPSKEELVLLCHMHGVPINHIKNRLQMLNRTLYNIIADNEKDPRMFYPRFRPEQGELITKFIDAFNIFRKVGLHE
jgi:hypothetical protein